MKPLLFVVSSATAYRLQRAFAQYCVERGQAVALVCDFPPNDLYSQVCKDAKSWGASVCSLDQLVVDGVQPERRIGRMPSPWRAWLFGWIARPKSSVFRKILGARVAAAQKLLTQWQPLALVVSEDGISGPAALIAAAHSHLLPIFDLPYGNGTQADLDVLLEEKAANNELIRADGATGRWIRWFAPVWVKRGRFAGALMFAHDYIAAREALGMTLRNAWIVHGGYADTLLVESEQMNDAYLKEGIPASKLLLTGSPYCDLMAAELERDPQAREAFRQPRPVAPGQLRLLVSWPTSYHASRAQHCEFDTYEAMTEAFLGWLNELPGCVLTVSLHPAVAAPTRTRLEALGMRIESDYIIGLIPRHDIYVSYFSSTQRWGIACGKPVVNYDAYGVGLTIYDSAPGFFNTRTFEEFKACISSLVEDPARFQAVCADQIQVAPHWGPVDGECMQRILSAVLSQR